MKMKKIFSNVCVIISTEIYNSNSEDSLVNEKQLSEICQAIGLQMQILEGDICSLRGDWDTINHAHKLIVDIISNENNSKISKNEVSSSNMCVSENMLIKKGSLSKDVPNPIVLSSNSFQEEHGIEDVFSDQAVHENKETDNCIADNIELTPSSQTCTTKVPTSVKSHVGLQVDTETCNENQDKYIHKKHKTKFIKVKSKKPILRGNISLKSNSGNKLFKQSNIKCKNVSKKTKGLKSDASQIKSHERKDKVEKKQDLQVSASKNPKKNICMKRKGSLDLMRKSRSKKSKMSTQKNSDVLDKTKSRDLDINQEISVGYQCSYCEFSSQDQSILQKHMKNKHVKEKKHSCSECGKNFKNLQALQRHEKSHENAKHVCDVCGKAYKTYQTFLSHKQSHEENYEKPEYQCEYEDCSKKFSTKYVLNNHIKSTHMGIRKTFLCPTCGKSFTQKNSYIQHANVHLGLKPYACDICDKSFSYEKSLKEHRYIHEETRRFKCEECGKAFKQSSALAIHMKVHSESKDHLCNICGKGFTQKQALHRHERIHNGEKPFSCSFCQKKFSDSSIIRRHLILVHRTDPKQWQEAVITEANDTNNYFVENIDSRGKKKGKRGNTSGKSKKKNVETANCDSIDNQEETKASNVELDHIVVQESDIAKMVVTDYVPAHHEFLQVHSQDIAQSHFQYSSTGHIEKEVTNIQPGMIPPNDNFTNITVDYLQKQPNDNVLQYLRGNVSNPDLNRTHFVSSDAYHVSNALSTISNPEIGHLYLTSIAPVSVYEQHIPSEKPADITVCHLPESQYAPDHGVLRKDSTVTPKPSAQLSTYIVVTQPYEGYNTCSTQL